VIRSRRRLPRWSLWGAVGLAVVAVRPAAAQPNAMPCDMSLRTVGLRVVSARGDQPLAGVAVTVVRRRGGTMVGEPRRTAADGTVDLVRDGEVRLAAPETLEVRLVRGAERKVVPYVVGPDAGRCHVTRLSGPPVIRW
jgi:hypothetical protein